MTAEGPVSEGSKKHGNNGRTVALGAVFVAVGAGALIWAISSALFALDAASWTETPCQILTAEMDESDDNDGGTKYRADFTYSYQFDGVKHVGERDSVMENFGKWKPAKDRLNALPVGAETVCYVDPAEPAAVSYTHLTLPTIYSV